MITAGIDCGAKSTKAIVIKDGKIVGKGNVLTGFDQEKRRAIAGNGINKCRYLHLPASPKDIV